VLDEGFIQANTVAAGATGGDIYINTPVFLMPANQQLKSGGDERLQFLPGGGISVIQAAAPDGVSGDITLDVPEVDVAASIIAVEAGFSRLPEIGKNPCAMKSGEVPSSLTWQGRGGLPSDETELTVTGGSTFGCRN